MDAFLEFHGPRKMACRVVTGEEASRLVSDLEERRAEAEYLAATGVITLGSASSILSRIDSDLEKLEKREGSGVERVEEPATLAEEWGMLGPAERNAFLRSMGVWVLVRSDGFGKVGTRVEFGKLSEQGLVTRKEARYAMAATPR